MKWFRLLFRGFYRLIKKSIIFKISPDGMHNFIIKFAKIWQRIIPLRVLTGFLLRHNDKNGRLKQEIFGIKFKNPVGLSAGFDKNIELQPSIEMAGFGFEIGGSVTYHSKKGNKRPWYYRLVDDKSIVVHAGLANVGLRKIKENIKKDIKNQNKMPLSVSVAVVAQGKNDQEADIIKNTIKAMNVIEKNNLSQMIEINISCPNVHDDQPFSKPESLRRLLKEVDKNNYSKPLFIKMPLIKWSKFEKLLDVILEFNIQGVTIANLVKDKDTYTPVSNIPDYVKGGLSGKPTEKLNNELIAKTYNKCSDRLKIIGVGGIFSAEDAYLKIRLGASLVALITGLIYEGPTIVGDINYDIEKMLKRDGYNNIEEAVGSGAELVDKTA